MLYNVESKQKYSYLEILIFGGIYDFFADGILGSIFQGSFSLITLFLLIILYPLFLITYSVIVLIPSYSLEEELSLLREKDKFEQTLLKYLFGLYPLLGLSILILVMFIFLILTENFIFGIVIIIMLIFSFLIWYYKKNHFINFI